MALVRADPRDQDSEKRQTLTSNCTSSGVTTQRNHLVHRTSPCVTRSDSCVAEAEQRESREAGIAARTVRVCYSAYNFLDVPAPVDSGLSKVFCSRQWRLHVNGSPRPTCLPRLRLYKSRHARERNHQGHRVAMCILRRDLQSADGRRVQTDVIAGLEDSGRSLHTRGLSSLPRLCEACTEPTHDRQLESR